MKIKLKGFMVIDPIAAGVYPRRENFYIGGVASSCASEEAGQYGGFVVPLEGEYDSSDLKNMYIKHIDRLKDDIQRVLDGVDRTSTPKDMALWASQIKEYQLEIEKIEEDEEKQNLNPYTNSVHVKGLSKMDLLRKVQKALKPLITDYRNGEFVVKIKTDQYTGILQGLTEVLGE